MGTSRVLVVGTSGVLIVSALRVLIGSALRALRSGGLAHLGVLAYRHWPSRRRRPVAAEDSPLHSACDAPNVKTEPPRHGIPRGMVSRPSMVSHAARYPARHGIPRGMGSHAAWFPAMGAGPGLQADANIADDDRPLAALPQPIPARASGESLQHVDTALQHAPSQASACRAVQAGTRADAVRRPRYRAHNTSSLRHKHNTLQHCSNRLQHSSTLQHSTRHSAHQRSSPSSVSAASSECPIVTCSAAGTAAQHGRCTIHPSPPHLRRCTRRRAVAHGLGRGVARSVPCQVL